VNIALLITVVFVFLVWLVFFQLKWLQWSIPWAVVSGFFGLHLLLIFLIGVRFAAPYTTEAKVVQHTIQLVPRLPEPTLVTAVLVEANAPGALTAFAEVETLTNERLLAQRLQYQSDGLVDRTESVRIANVRYEAGSLDLLSVLELLAGQIETESDLIQLRYAQLANRIDLHLALGGSFDAAPVVAGPPQN